MIVQMGTGLRLRAPRHDDWPRVHEWGSAAAVIRYQPWGPNTPDQSRTFVADAVESWQIPTAERVRWYWMAEHRDYGVVGAGELNIRSRQHRQAEISYIVHPNHWRRGYATSIATQLLATAFQHHQCHRVFATCDPRNVASAAVIRKIGMTYEGRLRSTLQIRGGWRDSDIFSILENEWQPTPSDH